MLSRREKLLIRPWQDQKYKNHRKNIQSAKPKIDIKSPPQYSHITNKLKKLQSENERLDKIKKENVRLLQRLSGIMSTKRLENFWSQPRPNFLNRERIDFTKRPKTCKGRLETTNTMNNKNVNDKQKQQMQNDYQLPISISTKKKFTYCSTCSGKPIKMNQVISEERIPWEPPRKSWNVKIHTNEFQLHKCCSICCKP